MQLVVYIDTYFLINVFMDFIILLVVKKINLEDSTYTRSSLTRICLSAAFGGALACLGIVIREWQWLMRFLFFYVLGSFGMLLIAFPYCGIKKFFIKLVELYVVTFCIGGLIPFLYYHGGISTYFGESLRGTIFENISVWNLIEGTGIFIVFLPIISAVFRHMKTEQEVMYPLTIRFHDKVVSGMGLVDTGNLLKDPISRRPVLIAQYDWIKKIFSEEQQSLLSKCMKTGMVEQISEKNYMMIRMIPFQSIGKENGLLTAVVVDELTTGTEKKCKKWEKVIIALYPKCLSVQGNYQVILQKDFI